MSNLIRLKPGWGRVSAVVGGLVWLLLFIPQIGDSPETTLMQRIVLLGILVIVPLGLSLVPAANSSDEASLLYRLALLAQPFAALGAIVSFLLERGFLAGGLAILWLGEAGLIAMFGLQRLARPQLRSSAEVSIDAGLIFVPVAGFWMVVHRLGIQLLNYGDTIILLTAVHFHFAGYAAPILAGLAGRRLGQYRRVSRLFKLVPLGIIGGTPLVAAGISFSPALALAGTIMIALALVVLAVLVLGWVIPSLESIPGRVLLLVSSVSCLPAMALACAYAYSIVFHKLIIDIPQMAMTHGVANAFGFSLCGLLGWTLVLTRKGAEQE